MSKTFRDWLASKRHLDEMEQRLKDKQIVHAEKEKAVIDLLEKVGPIVYENRLYSRSRVDGKIVVTPCIDYYDLDE